MHAATWTPARKTSDFLFRIKVMPGKHRRFYLFESEF